MIERVAEAIRLRAIERGHPVHPVVAHHLAAAALEAMREPTAYMLLAGDTAYRQSVGGAYYGGMDGMVVAARAMVDEALSLPQASREGEA